MNMARLPYLDDVMEVLALTPSPRERLSRSAPIVRATTTPAAAKAAKVSAVSADTETWTPVWSATKTPMIPAARTWVAVTIASRATVTTVARKGKLGNLIGAA